MFEELINYLGSFLDAIFSMILFPIVKFFILIFVSVVTVYNAFVGFINAFYGLFTNIYGNIGSYISDVLPSPFVALLMLGISIAILQRIYFYVKDISILGNKI